MTDITTQWYRIEAHFEKAGLTDTLHDGASPDDIAQLERDLNLTLPTDLRDSLLRHNGSDEGAWPYGGLLDVKGIKSETDIWRGLLDDGTFGDRADHDASLRPGMTQTGWWHHGWVPLDADGGGNGHVVDTAPGENGSLGQVLFMDHEVGPTGPQFGSTVEYLQEIADRLDSGKLRWENEIWEEY